MHAAQQYLGINAGIIKMVCEGINNCKSGTSKYDNCVYEFQYIEEDDMPDDHFKSANIRPRMSKEEKNKRQKESVKKWIKKEFICSDCGNSYKNSYKHLHKKHCKGGSRMTRTIEKIKINEYEINRISKKIDDKYEKNCELKRFKVGDRIVKKSYDLNDHCRVHCDPKFYEILEESEKDFVMIELEPEYDYCEIDNDVGAGYAYVDTLHFNSFEKIRINKSTLNKDTNYCLHHKNETYQFFCDFNHFQEFYQ